MLGNYLLLQLIEMQWTAVIPMEANACNNSLSLMFIRLASLITSLDVLKILCKVKDTGLPAKCLNCKMIADLL